MPTGYTAGVADGTTTTFTAFALTCARAFGATLDMRDLPLDAVIPERFEPSDHHSRGIAEAKLELARLRALSPGDAQREMQQEHSRDMARWRQRSAEDAVKRVRYQVMLDAVATTAPPTPEHTKFWEFMRGQLVESLRFDCGGKYNVMPTLMRWPQWVASKIVKTQWSLDYDTEHLDKELGRAAHNSQWVNALRGELRRIDTNSY